MRDSVNKDMAWAQAAMIEHWPRFSHLVGGGELISNESATSNATSHLDMFSGIDWFIRQKRNGVETHRRSHHRDRRYRPHRRHRNRNPAPQNPPVIPHRPRTPPQPPTPLSVETWRCMWCEQPACNHPTWRHRLAYLTALIINWEFPCWTK